jgi:Na+-transporting NADH:ubiquinone oxidoreductase subunit NqrA
MGETSNSGLVRVLLTTIFRRTPLRILPPPERTPLAIPVVSIETNRFTASSAPVYSDAASGFSGEIVFKLQSSANEFNSYA